MRADAFRVHALAPVVALDIDGTQADYYRHFHWFAELYTQKNIQVRWPETADPEYSDALGLPKDVYRDIKLAYRQGGMKRAIPPIDDGVSQLARTIRRRFGYQVWICTTRPWNRLDNIDRDTQFWIDQNLGQVDGVIYGEDKYETLIDNVGRDRVVIVADDLPENTFMARELGLPTILRSGAHNRVHRINSPEEQVAHHTKDIFYKIKEHHDGHKH